MESTSLVKALGLLEATASSIAGRPLAELAAEVGLTKPTAHRILKALGALGYLERGPGGVYRQTSKVQRLVSNDGAQRLVTLAEPVMENLHKQTQETVNLGILRYDRVIYLRILESPQPLRRVATPQSVDPFHSTALGRAIAAFLPEPQQRTLLNQARLQPATPCTLTNIDSLRQLLSAIARDGYAVEVDETDVGVTCIGAPILAGRYPCAAISLSIPTARASKSMMPSLIKRVRAAAREISQRLDGEVSGVLPHSGRPPRRLSRSKK